MFVLVSVSQVRGTFITALVQLHHLGGPRPAWSQSRQGPHWWRALWAQPCCRTAGKGSRGAEGGSKNNIPPVRSLERHCAEDDIFFEWQCDTELFSIAFTWTLRLANFLQGKEKMLRTVFPKIETYVSNSNKFFLKNQMVFQCFSKDSLEDCLNSVGGLILSEIEVNPEARLVLPFSQGWPVQTQAAQRFTTICINLQMWLSSGLEVAVFAFPSHSFRNVSELFQTK